MSGQHTRYASKFPKELKLAIDGLSGQNEVGYAIVMLLVEEEALKFTEISEMLDLHPQTVSDALDDLQRGGLIEKKAGERIGDQSTGPYVLTTFGNRVLDSLYEATNPDANIHTRKALSEVIQTLSEQNTSGPPTGRSITSRLVTETLELLDIPKWDRPDSVDQHEPSSPEIWIEDDINAEMGANGISRDFKNNSKIGPARGIQREVPTDA